MAVHSPGRRTSGYTPPPPEPEPPDPFHASAPVTDDALTRRAAAHLSSFNTWLAGAPGHVGEFGWPPFHADAAAWQGAAHALLHHLDTLGLPVMHWSVFERSDNQTLATYTMADPIPAKGGVVAAQTNAGKLLEGHLATGGRKGVNYGLGAYAGEATLVATTQHLSNARDICVYEELTSAADVLTDPGGLTSYNYGSSWTYAYLASRGLEEVRLMFRWERMQRTLSTPLDAVEIARFDAAVDEITSRGMICVISPANFGVYYWDDGTQGVRIDIGGPNMAVAHFYDLWSRLAARYAANPLVEFDLMNEPAASFTAAQWQTYTQGAVNAIRAAGATQRIYVPGYGFSRPAEFAGYHPAGPWIVGGGDIGYTCHWYFDPSGGYAVSYASKLAEAAAEGY